MNIIVENEPHQNLEKISAMVVVTGVRVCAPVFGGLHCPIFFLFGRNCMFFL